jgi:hypothetical protein
MRGFVAGLTKKKDNLWDKYLIDKRDLANEIVRYVKK